MPVARIITRTPAESEELRRQLTAAGYSVKFTAPEEEFDDADLVVAAATVHSDYALQYASEVAAEADADIIVAPGVVAGSFTADRVPAITPDVDAEAPPAAGVLFGTVEAIKDEQERGPGLLERAASAWQQFRQQRAVAAEQKRLEQEHRAQERQERERLLREQRAAAEARMVAERERLRVERAAHEERIRREQEEIRAREMERARAEAEAQRARMAAEAERARLDQERAWREQEQQRALEAERIRIEQERAREEQERVAREAVLLSAATPAPAPHAPAAEPVRSQVPPPAHPFRASTLPRHAARRHAPARRALNRQQRFQRAALIASVVALVAMIAMAIALNIQPSSPMPASVTNNPVQEQSPFGAASVGTTGGAAKPAPAQTQASKGVSANRSSMPQSDAVPAPTKPSAQQSRRVRRHIDSDIAEDEVVIHHYGPQPKHPPSTQTRAGVPRYTDQ